MKWNEVFSDPDSVGQSEYGAIHDCVMDGINSMRMENGTPELYAGCDDVLSKEECQHINAMLDEIIGHAQSLKKALAK